MRRPWSASDVWLCPVQMTAVLPTLAREWASYGAAHALPHEERGQGLGLAAAANTFASYTCGEKQQYFSVRTDYAHPC